MEAGGATLEMGGSIGLSKSISGDPIPFESLSELGQQVFC